MKVTYKDEIAKIPDRDPYAKAILALVRAYQSGGASTTDVPTRNDIRSIWRNLDDRHKNLLRHIARSKSGRVTQIQLQKSLDLDSPGLRGVLNGLTRICIRLQEVKALGYNATNRQYYLDADVAATVNSLKSDE